MNLVIFIVAVLSRRLVWCGLQEIQSHWSKLMSSSSPSTPTINRSLKGGSHVGKSARIKGDGVKQKGSQMNLTHWLVVLCTVVVIAWSIVRLVQHTSLFNLLFLFYPYVPISVGRRMFTFVDIISSGCCSISRCLVSLWSRGASDHDFDLLNHFFITLISTESVIPPILTLPDMNSVRSRP